MPAEMSREMKAELDQLEPSEAIELVLGYIIVRHRLLNVGETKLVAIAIEGRLRKAYVELGISAKTLDLLAA